MTESLDLRAGGPEKLSYCDQEAHSYSLPAVFLVGWLPTGFGVREAVADSWSRERELGGSLPLLLYSGLPSSGRSWIPV